MKYEDDKHAKRRNILMELKDEKINEDGRH